MVEIKPIQASDLAEPLKLLEESLRDGDPLPRGFVDQLHEEVARGDVEVLSAIANDCIVGVVVLAFRLGVSAGGRFASVEELYVKLDARREGIGRALLEAAEDRCYIKDVSYIEVQAVERDAAEFYASCGYEPELDVRVMSRSVPFQRRGD